MRLLVLMILAWGGGALVSPRGGLNTRRQVPNTRVFMTAEKTGVKTTTGTPDLADQIALTVDGE